MVSRRGLGAGGVLCHGPRQLWAVPARGFGWVFPLHLLLPFAQKQKKRYHALLVPLVLWPWWWQCWLVLVSLVVHRYSHRAIGQWHSGSTAPLHLWQWHSCWLWLKHVWFN